MWQAWQWASLCVAEVSGQRVEHLEHWLRGRVDAVGDGLREHVVHDVLRHLGSVREGGGERKEGREGGEVEGGEKREGKEGASSFV